jgi:hypothetical protein
VAGKAGLFVGFLVSEVFFIVILNKLFLDGDFLFLAVLFPEESFLFGLLLLSLFDVGNLFLELTDNFLNHVLFLVLFAGPHFGHQRVEPVLDHVLSSGFFEDGHQLAPPFSELSHIFENCEVLFGSPVPVFLLVV